MRERDRSRRSSELLPEAAEVFCPPEADDPREFISYDYHSSQIYGFAYTALKRRMDVDRGRDPAARGADAGPDRPSGLRAAGPGGVAADGVTAAPAADVAHCDAETARDGLEQPLGPKPLLAAAHALLEARPSAPSRAPRGPGRSRRCRGGRRGRPWRPNSGGRPRSAASRRSIAGASAAAPGAAGAARRAPAGDLRRGGRRSRRR